MCGLPGPIHFWLLTAGGLTSSKERAIGWGAVVRLGMPLTSPTRPWTSGNAGGHLGCSVAVCPPTVR